MTVYVDNARLLFGRMLMCHMVADEIDELNAMADRIGVGRRWLQDDASWPHYDICLSKRRLAVRYGAIERSSREMARMIRAWKQRNKGSSNHVRA
jgi:hypothetical protein